MNLKLPSHTSDRGFINISDFQDSVNGEITISIESFFDKDKKEPRTDVRLRKEELKKLKAFLTYLLSC